MNRSLFAAACSLLPLSLSAQTFIFDLGGVLVTPDKLGIASTIGIRRILKYVLTGHNPLKLQDRAFEVLYEHDRLCGRSEWSDEREIPYAEHRRMPLCMRDWMMGTMRGVDILVQVKSTIKRLAEEGFFSNHRERVVIERTIECMFDPQILGSHMHPTKDAAKLMKRLRALVDKSEGRHRIVILSNFDLETFKVFYKSGHPLFEDVLRHVNPEDIILSADIQMMKPQSCIFKHVLQRYPGLTPDECIFFDDQEENIQAAQACGITSYMIKNGSLTPARLAIEHSLSDAGYTPASKTNL